MSYVNIMEYKIVPTEPFKIIKGCAGCEGKQIFACKGRFRVNANGNRLDVWLIYGCEKCGYTYNLPIYERVKPNKISKIEYQEFLVNDENTVFKYGTDKSIFVRNRVEIAWKLVRYELISMTQNKFGIGKTPILIKLYNPCDILVRKDKVIANIFQISRSEVTNLLNEGRLFVNMLKNNRREESND